MTPALLSDRTRICRVRVRTACRDALQVSLRAGALLERLDLRPPGLPSAAILLVRALRDPLPGSVPLARHGETAPARWREAVTANLARLAREAARPASGPVPSSAGAVLFVDESEMIACLVRDWLRGRVAERWWWRSVLGELGPREWLRRHALVRGEVMVPAIAALAGPDAAAWLARLDDAEAVAAVAAVARTHAVTLRAAEDGSAAEPGARDDRRAPAGIEPGRRAGSRAAALERLVAAVPEALAPALRPSQRRLLALALVLARAPSWARTPQLPLALRELDRGLPDTRAYATPGVTEMQAPHVPRAVIATAAARMRDAPTPLPESPDAKKSLGAPARGPGESRAVARERAQAASARAREAPRDAAPVIALAPAREVPAMRAATRPAASSANPVPESAPAVERAARVRTSFGGIFYLLNAALALKLYADFTSPRGTNLRLSPWSWLAVIGREWFGREFVRDPVWRLLAGLAGRGRRRLRRPRGLDGQVEELLARLALALGEKDGRADIPALVCRHPAEVAATAARVDVHLALSDLPLALRVAGLDRDPGWIPAAGRTIAFHFE